MHLLAFGDAAWNQQRKIRHQGTFNANPLSAAAGIVTLEEARTGAPQERATRSANTLRDGFNAELRARSLRGCVAYGDSSIVHLVLGSPKAFPPGQWSDDISLHDLKMGIPAHLRMPFRLAMLNYGVDLMRGRSAFVSAAHSPEDISATVRAFGAALDIVKDERRM
jgi:glutamate-1-semialdehyde 2,1-aminomutase